MILAKMFSLKWLSTTVLVLIGTALCVRLGIWQLDRLAQRRGFNAQVASMRTAAVLDLNRGVPAEIGSMEWRAVTVTGRYDFEEQVALRNQYDEAGRYGYHLITPLVFDPSTIPSVAGQAGAAVLVDRGWIPADGNARPEDWRAYDEAGEVTVSGQLRLGQDKPAFGGVADPEYPQGENRLALWNNLTIARISAQLPFQTLPVFVQPNVEVNDELPPIPSQPVLELDEGPHLGYAFQWFSFGTILFVGYPFYLRKQA